MTTTNMHSERPGFGRIPRFCLAGLTLGLASAEAAAQVCNSMSFTNVTASAGINHSYLRPSTPDGEVSGGAVADDFNGDGWLDLYVVQGAGGPNMLYINDQAGGFVDEATARSADIEAASVAASASDFDNDGDIDIGVSIAEGQFRILVNDGTGNFTSTIVLPGALKVATSSSWGDVDNDGFLELAVGQWNTGEQSFFLYRNLGGTNLSQYEFRTVPHQDVHVFSPRFADLNGDRLADLHVVADSAESQLYLNIGGGQFNNVTSTNGTGVNPGNADMGHAIGDYDRDGDLDIFTSNVATETGNRLYRNNGAGVFTGVQDEAGVLDGDWGWGAAFGDLDNDGDLDIYHVTGWHELFNGNAFVDTPARLFMNDGDGTFTEAAACAGADDTGQGKGMLQFDYDNDGDLDIFIVNNLDVTEPGGAQARGPPLLLRNDTSNGNHWLQVTLAGTPPLHRNGIGSRVLVDAGGNTMLHEMHASTNFMSQDSGRIAHFGLGASTLADSVTAEWVNGDATVIANVPGDQRVSVPSPVATPSARIVGINEIVTADASAEPSPVDWEVEGVVYPNPLSVSFDTVGVKDLTLNVYDPARTTVIRQEILRVTVQGGATGPAISSPAPGSTLSGSSVTFNFADNGGGATFWALALGTSPGADDLGDSGVNSGSVTSTTLAGLPTDGSTIFARLYWVAGEVGVDPTQISDFTYVGGDVVAGDPEVTLPVPGSLLPGTTITFGWTNNSANVADWRLQVGTSIGSSNIYDSGQLASNVLSATVAGLPADGSTVYVRLSSTVDSVTEFTDYTYTAFTQGADPGITSPAPGSILSSNSETFTFSDGGRGATFWQLALGTSQGAADLGDSGVIAGSQTSTTLSGLPTDGSTIYATLYWVAGQVGVDPTQILEYAYTATDVQPPDPEIRRPAPVSTLAGDTVTFYFDEHGAGVTNWQLLLGTAPGASDLADTGILAGDLDLTTLSGLPTDGSTIHATLNWITGPIGTAPLQTAQFEYVSGPPAVDNADPSVARRWNDVLLDGIRGDFARPTVHARNLWHISAAMYDAWSAYDGVATTYLLGKTIDGFSCLYAGDVLGTDIQLAREEAISYAAHRLIHHRFAGSPGEETTLGEADALMAELGYDTSIASADTSDGTPAKLGNRIAECYIDFGLQDGSNEANAYANEFYTTSNPPIEPYEPGNPNIVDLDHWQQVSLPIAIDQSGNPILSTPPFLSPEWGQVTPFALSSDDLTIYERDGFEYYVYHDPGAPPSIHGTYSDWYKWGFEMVAIWSGHLDPADGVLIDISPASFGNLDITQYPTNYTLYDQFYDHLTGGDVSTGHPLNPITGLPYEPQLVPRGDYARVLAEFWADGPDSETPPGHWFTILNGVNDHPFIERRIAGAGDEVGPLEWDVKAYFTLGGAMHDSAVTAWGIKGWYDYLRPVSAIRAMSDRGQSSDPLLPSYDPDGIRLYPGHIELVESGDPLAGDAGENVDKIKILAWRGPDYVQDPATDVGGVDWILAENWWPYQRPTFVTPPFAGFVSGHSTFSRAAAEVLTAFTGSPFFPGGMGEYPAPANEFLVFEEGPSVDVTLQWATYRDASEQTSLSRIWGGIHPPADDIPGRLAGIEIGLDAYALARTYFGQ